MTEEAIYKLARSEFNDAVANYCTVCDAVKAGKATEQHALTALNLIISLGWRLKDAAMRKEPAPVPRTPLKKERK
jgi:hypothetical protein